MNKNTQIPNQRKPFFQYRVQWIDDDGWSRGYRQFNVLESAIMAARQCFERVPRINKLIKDRAHHWNHILVEKWHGPNRYDYTYVHVVDSSGARPTEHHFGEPYTEYARRNGIQNGGAL
jgi:hypothetical protein